MGPWDRIAVDDRHGVCGATVPDEGEDVENLELVRRIEAVVARAWPPLSRQTLHGWVMRHSDGVTRRANSVYPVAWDESAALGDALDGVETFYRERGLLPRFQMSPAALPTGLDDVLAARGYRVSALTAVQTVSLAAAMQRLPQAGGWRVEVDATPGPAWLAIYADAEGASEKSLQTRRAIMAAVTDNGCCVVAYDDAGRAVAVGSAVAAEGYMGVFNVTTVPASRRRGAALAVMGALAGWGATQQVDQIYLQVMANNAPALALYARLGFATCYHYHYRELA